MMVWRARRLLLPMQAIGPALSSPFHCVVVPIGILDGNAALDNQGLGCAYADGVALDDRCGRERKSMDGMVQTQPASSA